LKYGGPAGSIPINEISLYWYPKDEKPWRGPIKGLATSKGYIEPFAVGHLNMAVERASLLT
jgi:hypothetical protein